MRRRRAVADGDMVTAAMLASAHAIGHDALAAQLVDLADRSEASRPQSRTPSRTWRSWPADVFPRRLFTSAPTMQCCEWTTPKAAQTVIGLSSLGSAFTVDPYGRPLLLKLLERVPPRSSLARTLREIRAGPAL